jgi:tetratricopeptide (TPR) repeat protein
MTDTSDSNTAQQLIYHAAALIEADDLAGAEAALRDAANVASVAGRTVELIQAKGFLGELLLNTGRTEEALEELEDVLDLAREEDVDAVLVEGEVRLAREVRAKAAGLE